MLAAKEEPKMAATTAAYHTEWTCAAHCDVLIVK